MSSLSILLAEDEILTRLDIKEMLLAAGHTVCAETNSGDEAVRLAQQFTPDLAILDVRMQGLDGLDTAKILHGMNIPVLILTAYSKPSFINRAEKVNVYSYLVKPVSEQDLLPAIQIAYARWKEVQHLKKQLDATQTKLDNQKSIAHARTLLAARNNITEYEAHQVLVHQAMDARITIEQMAEQIIKNNNR